MAARFAVFDPESGVCLGPVSTAALCPEAPILERWPRTHLDLQLPQRRPAGRLSLATSEPGHAANRNAHGSGRAARADITSIQTEVKPGNTTYHLRTFPFTVILSSTMPNVYIYTKHRHVINC